MVHANIVADSVNPEGVRLTSWILTYPRYIHSEFMTHRVFSRNAASSRAIKFGKMVAAIKDKPAWPSRFGVEKKGMQIGDVLDPEDEESAKHLLGRLLERSIEVTETLQEDEPKLHKSILNRYLEPWAHITVLATATNHDGFFAQRAHPQAESTFQELAYKMLKEYLNHQPSRVAWGEWHFPRFGGTQPWLIAQQQGIETALKIATARCARLSYLTFDGEYSHEKDCELHDQLAADNHWSPFEHCACAEHNSYIRSNFDTGSMLCGWEQYRKNFTTEMPVLEVEDRIAILDKAPDWIKERL